MLNNIDLEVYELIKREQERQNQNIVLIASENYASNAVLEAQGSILTNKYAEGYPKRRYYGGCEFVDEIEQLAIDRLCKIFNSKYANVQPHSGSSANLAVYRAILKNGDTVLGMDLTHGGHLTHGHHLNFSGIDYNFASYGINDNTGILDYEEILTIAKNVKPKLIVAGASAYAREIDFKKFKQIADEVGALLMVDMAHIAGLVAAGFHQNPTLYADVVTSTSHKTLRGPRGGFILTNNKDIARKINREVFPGIQGGPLMHVIAAKAVAFKEALQPEFINYQKQVILNAKTLANELSRLGYKIVFGGTDTHLLLVDIKSSLGITGNVAEDVLESVYITTNKNTIPNDSEKAMYTSGLRLGTPSITTRGFGVQETKTIAKLIDKALRNRDNETILAEVRNEVQALTNKFA